MIHCRPATALDRHGVPTLMVSTLECLTIFGCHMEPHGGDGLERQRNFSEADPSAEISRSKGIDTMTTTRRD